MGPRCEIDYNECTNLTICEHGGRCINTEGGFTCQCPPGWTGPTCNIGKIFSNTLQIVSDSGYFSLPVP